METRVTGREYRWKSGGREYSIHVEELNGVGSAQVGDAAFSFTVHDRKSIRGWLEIDGRNVRYYTHRNGKEVWVWIGGRTYRLEPLQPDRNLNEAAASSGSDEVRALMPGKILRIDVAEGDAVAERQTVIVMESMKMESALQAPRAGKVAAVRCKAGDIVEMGAVLLVIESA